MTTSEQDASREREARLRQLRADVDAGFRQLDGGKTAAFDEGTAERIKRRERARLPAFARERGEGKGG